MDLRWRLQPERAQSVQLQALETIVDSLCKTERGHLYGLGWQKVVQAIQEVIDSGCVPFIIRFLDKKGKLKDNAYKILPKLCTGTLKQLHEVMDTNLLERVVAGKNPLYNCLKDSILVEMCRTCIREGDSVLLNRILSSTDVHGVGNMGFISRESLEGIAFDSEIVEKIYSHIIERLPSTYNALFTRKNLCSCMRLLTYDQTIARFAFDKKLVSKWIEVLSKHYDRGVRSVFLVLKWLTRFYPREVFEACASAPKGDDLCAKVKRLPDMQRLSANDRIVDLLLEFVLYGYTKGVVAAGWLPYLVSVAPRPRYLQRLCRVSPAENKYLRERSEFHAYHLIAKIVLDTLETNPAQVSELVAQGAIEPLCRYLQHEPHAHVAPYQRPCYRRSSINSRRIQRLDEDHTIISSPLLALVGIMILGEVEKNRRRLPANPYAQRTKGAGGLKGSLYFRSSYDVNNRAHARVLAMQFSIT